MPTKNDVLSILENERGRFVSGQELAEALHLSRTAVWKAVKNLEEDGHRILAIKNRGYMLDERSDMLSEEGIRVHMPDRYIDCPIYVFDTTDSTNTEAKKLALDNAAHGTMLLAEEQTAGRGRSGKSFFSPREAGLYMSIILKPDLGISDPQLITIAAAVSVCEAIEKIAGLRPQIKWVNDIYLNGKKICGILTEAITDLESGGIESIVVGIGINCIETNSLPDDLRDIAGALGKDGLSRNHLAAEIAAGVLDSFNNLENREIIDEYRKRSLMYGRDISFLRGDERLFATVTGINDIGNLQARLKSGEEIVLSSGEVSIGSLKNLGVEKNDEE
ncbi:MAG: biotin--[acetyl-CoA-carboxylase] ligase [Clostridiales bacterium]|jgi:BirA family biotin operon repressor/biotin-[acetyl-CoA-carboxylase] ligase|nr:biotin--[acetyl-CoA-carboxylase] ligase [Clostridiales bacterium]